MTCDRRAEECGESPVDANANGGDHSARWSKMVGQAVMDREAETCAKAYAALSTSLSELAMAKEALDALPESQKPVPNEERVRDILATDTLDAVENKVKKYARRDAARRRVEIATAKTERCRGEAERTYEALVNTLVRQE